MALISCKRGRVCRRFCAVPIRPCTRCVRGPCANTPAYTAEDSNAFYRRNLAAGQKGLSIAFDWRPIAAMIPSSARYRRCRYGRRGDRSLYDMRVLFDGIPLDQMSVSMTMNGAVLPIMALFIAAGSEQGVAPEKLSGTIQNDILKEFMVRNTYIYPPRPSMRIISDIFTYTAAHAEIQLHLDFGYHMQEAGATADLELAYAGRSGICARRDRGWLGHRPFRPAAFLLGRSLNFFMEVAKCARALLWARMIKISIPLTLAHSACAPIARLRAGR